MIDGLKPYPEMKDSDVPWLGLVPRHWEVRRLRYLFKEVDSRSERGAETHLSMSQKLGLIPSSMLDQQTLVSESYAGGKLCERNDLVLNRLKAHLRVFARASQAGVTSPDYTVLRPRVLIRARPLREVIEPEYLFAFSQGAGFARWKDSTFVIATIQNISAEKYADLPIPLPSVEEQLAIVAYIRDATGTVKVRIDRAQREIPLLREYRVRLIADVVSGKLDVREASARLPDESNEPDANDIDTPLEDDDSQVEEMVESAE